MSELTGDPVLAYDEMHQAEHDCVLASAVALLLCSVVFIVAYSQVWRPFKAALCLLIGLGYTLGFTTLAIGHLNILSIAFAPMLIGLAIDFGIHFISRYEEEMRNRRSETEAIDRAVGLTGRGLLTGGVAMAAAFLAMALTNFKGIREMGIHLRLRRAPLPGSDDVVPPGPAHARATESARPSHRAQPASDGCRSKSSGCGTRGRSWR